MIELEIQGLAAAREGLLIEVGRLVVANRFTVQRQRLVQDPHGVLMTLVAKGPARKQAALQSALDGCERFISVRLFPYDESEPQPHFAASRNVSATRSVAAPAPSTTVPPSPERESMRVSKPIVAASGPLPDADRKKVNVALFAADMATPEPVTFESDVEFLLPEPDRVTPAPPVDSAPLAKSVPPAPVELPFVELVQLEPDEAAVDKALRSLEYDYPAILPKLQELADAVASGARQSSLTLSGQRIGAWLGERERASLRDMAVADALEAVGVPALAALVDVENQGGQLHIRNSPLCRESGLSGCSFFSGFVEGLLGPLTAPRELSIIALCCVSYGADECVLAVSE